MTPKSHLVIDHSMMKTWTILLLILLFCDPIVGRLPSYNVLSTHLRQSSLARRRPQQLSDSNSFLRRQSCAGAARLQQQGRLPTRRYILDFFDPLEPFELAWEFYCKRYEILDELVVKLVQVTKRNSIRALTVVGGAVLVAEVAARVGILGDFGTGLSHYIKNSERFNDGTQERVYQKASTFIIDGGMGALRQLRRFGGKSKFAISVSTGVIFGRSVIQATAFAVLATLVSFFFIETLSFLGVIGDMGESILDWVDDERDRHAGWTMQMARFHKSARRKMSFEWLEELYAAAVDEEKIASFGFSVGTVFALLT
jgi:hypothetical protein